MQIEFLKIVATNALIKQYKLVNSWLKNYRWYKVENFMTN